MSKLFWVDSRWGLLSVVLLAAVSGVARGQTADEVRRAQEAKARAAEIALLEAANRRVAAARDQAVAAQPVQFANQVGVKQQVWPDEQFERWVFSQFGSSVEAHRRLDSQLTLLIEDIDRACTLADDQKNKIYLTGRGDIKRLFDGYETLKAKFRSLNNDAGRLQELMPDVSPFQSAIQAGVFHDDSLLAKSMRHTLTAEQFERYDGIVRERRASQHRSNVQRAVALIEQGSPLRLEQRRALTDLLAQETKPPRRPSQYDLYVLIFQIAAVPDDKLRPLLDDTQWKNLKRVVDQYRAIEPTLRQQGVLPDKDGAEPQR